MINKIITNLSIMKKLLFILAFIPFLGFAQVPATLIDLSEYHNNVRLMEMVDKNFVDITTGLYALPAFHVNGTTYLDSTLMLGTFGDTQQILVPETTNTSPLLGIFPMVNFEADANKVFAGAHSRMLAITADQVNDVSILGMESQLRVKGVSLANGVHAGLWAYAEQSGTTVLSDAGTFDAINATVESASTFTTGATERISGITIDGSINAGASRTIDGSTNFSGLFIKSNGLDWYDGIYITGADNDIKLQNDETIDNATNGTVKVTADVLQTTGYFKMLVTSGNTHDTVPTDAELDSITGTTPAGAGAGARQKAYHHPDAR